MQLKFHILKLTFTIDLGLLFTKKYAVEFSYTRAIFYEQFWPIFTKKYAVKFSHTRAIFYRQCGANCNYKNTGQPAERLLAPPGPFNS